MFRLREIMPCCARADEPDAQLIQVAIALLPDGATDGSRVRRVMLDYTLL